MKAPSQGPRPWVFYAEVKYGLKLSYCIMWFGYSKAEQFSIGIEDFISGGRVVLLAIEGLADCIPFLLS